MVIMLCIRNHFYRCVVSFSLFLAYVLHNKSKSLTILLKIFQSFVRVWQNSLKCQAGKQGISVSISGGDMYFHFVLFAFFTFLIGEAHANEIKHDTYQE